MIIGLVGNKNVGKDTLADYLVENKKFIKYAFADPLKKGLKELFGLSDEQLNGNLKEVIDPEWNITPRELMQFFGTEVMQFKLQELIPTLKRTFFLKRFEQFVLDNPDKNIVVSDVRFQHELDKILQHQGIIIKISRKNASKTFLNHVSESEIDNFKNITYSFDNDSSKEDLFRLVDQIFTKEILNKV